MHSWSTFGARTSHGQTRTHKIHHSLDLGEATTFSLIIYFVLGHGTSTQMSFCLEILKWEFRNSQNQDSRNFWNPITLWADLWLRWDLKQSCSSRWELSNSMWHATYTQGDQGDSQLLVVGSQINNLTPNPSFGHNLCFRYPNGS